MAGKIGGARQSNSISEPLPAAEPRWIARRLRGSRRDAKGSVACTRLKGSSQIGRELGHDLRDGRFDHLDVLTILSCCPGKHAVGVNLHPGTAVRWFESEGKSTLRAASALSIGALGLEASRVLDRIDLL